MDINTWVDNKDRNYISVLKFINDLYKKLKVNLPLVTLIEYVVDNYDLESVKLYQSNGLQLYEVPQSGLLDNETFLEVLNNIYNELDDTQIGINFSDDNLKPFKCFYVCIDDLPNLSEPQDIPKIKTSRTFTRPQNLPSTSNNNDNNHDEIITPNKYQIITMKFDLFTPHEASCLVAGIHPEFHGSDDDLEIASKLIDRGLSSKKIQKDEQGYINTDDLKRFLFDKEWILKGFNDDLGVVTQDDRLFDNQNERILKKQRTIGRLETENNKLKKRISELEQQLNELQSSQPIDYEQLEERTEDSYLTTIGLLIQLMTAPKGLDNKAPFQSQNLIINEIVDKKIYGQGKSTLEARFGKANQSLQESQKKG